MVLSVVAGPTPVPPVGSAAGVLRRPAGGTRAHGGRFSPLAVIERAEPARVPTLRDATMAVALNRLRPRRPALVALYLRRRAAAEPVDCGDAALTRILMSTQGLLIYDEQVVDMAVRLAGFSALEAEEFRIALASAGDDPDESAERATWRVRFIRGAVARGHAIARAEATFAALRQAAVGTVSRGACVVEAMRLLRDAYGFGAVRDGRAPGNPFVATREAEAQLSFAWLEDGPGESATVQTSPAASREALIDEPCELRRRA